MTLKNSMPYRILINNKHHFNFARTVEEAE